MIDQSGSRCLTTHLDFQVHLEHLEQLEHLEKLEHLDPLEHLVTWNTWNNCTKVTKQLAHHGTTCSAPLSLITK